MFRRLRERIAEEATKFPVGQLANNTGKLFPESEGKSTEANSSEDLITLSDSSSVVVPHTSPQQFSIGEDEDGSLSEQSTPQKKQNASPGDANAHHSSNSSNFDFSFGQEYRPSKKLSYVPQSDIESEREDPPTLNLDGISKDQLMAAIQSLKAKSYKYKNKYAEVVKNFKELRDEKIKIENTLIENQDKGLRRIAELREQCQLEQKAKAHLEENLRLLLDEKDSRICVLETQIKLLKDGGKSNSTKTLPEDCDSQFSDGGADTRSEDSSTSLSNDVSVLQEKVERLNHQISQDKKTITSQKDQITLLRKQNENLSQELEEKVKALNNLEDEQLKLKSEHEVVLKTLKDRLKELEKQQEESIMSMAETKRSMHEELELKEKQLIKAEEKAKQTQTLAEREKEAVSALKKKYEEEVRQLQHKLELTEKTLEDEKQILLHELSQGKTAAINLMQQECAKKIAAVEEEWKAKYEALQSSQDKASHTEVEELRNSLKVSEEKLKFNEQRIEELDTLVSVLEKENASLKNSLEKLEGGNIEASQEERLRCLKDKLEIGIANYKTQLEEMRIRIEQLETENGILYSERQTLYSERENLLRIQNEFIELRDREKKIESECKSKEDELRAMRDEWEALNKEKTQTVHAIQEVVKEKENVILKLKSNLESVSKEHKEGVEELHKKIKRLEIEREQLMLQAQERVSATEAKCREEIKALEEKCDKLILENKEIKKSLLAAESNLESASQEISRLKIELANTEKKLADVEKTKLVSESELSNKLEKLQQENKLLTHSNDNVEKLKAEKEELNEKLKTAIQQVKKIDALETERERLIKENEELAKEVKDMRTFQSESNSVRERLKILEDNESELSQNIEKLRSENENLKLEIVSLKDNFAGEKDTLFSEKEKLLSQIKQLESCVKDPQNVSLQDYLDNLKKEYEMAIKAKDDDMLVKLKQLVRDFSIQMDVKDKDSEQMITNLMEKNQFLEEKLQREHADLKQELFEKECALEEIRDSYEEALQEKDAKIKEQESIIKNLAPKDSVTESVHGTAESSDWDDTWVVPDEVADNSSPNHSTKVCDEHVQQIESLQEELSKCNSEIKELKVLLRLSPPDTMVNNNNSRDSLHSVPEPTEFEYLKNIIYEYMMGKEPVTLAKVIAAVLRFNDVQTQQVIRREEARHTTK